MEKTFELKDRVAYVSNEKGAPAVNSTGTIMGIDHVCGVALVKFDHFEAGHNGVSTVFSTVTFYDGYVPDPKARDMYWCNFSFIKKVEDTKMPQLRLGDVVEGKFPRDPFNLDDLTEDTRIVDCVHCFDKALTDITAIYRLNRRKTAYELIWKKGKRA